MRLIKQNQTAEPLVFIMVSSSDHVSPVTGITPTVVLSKNGGAFGSASGSVTEVGNGWYKVAGNATDANTLGPLILHASGSGADPTDMTYQIVAFDPRDSVSLGLTSVKSDIVSISGDSAAADNLERWYDGTVGFGTATSVITGSLSGSVGSVTGAVGSVTGAVGSVTNAASIATSVNTTLSSAHGAGSWEAPPGSPISAEDVWEYADRTLTGAVMLANNAITSNSLTLGAKEDISEQVDVLLTTNHGVGSWTASTLTAADIWTYSSRTLNDATMEQMVTRFLNMTEVFGPDFQFTELALSQAPTGGGGLGGDDFTESEENYIITTLGELKNITTQTKTMVAGLESSGGGGSNNNIVLINTGNMDNKYSLPTLVLPVIPPDFEEAAGTSRVDFANALFGLLAKATVTGITQTDAAPYDLTALASKVEALEDQRVPKMRSALFTGVTNGNVPITFEDIGTNNYMVVCNVLTSDTAGTFPTVTFALVAGSQTNTGATILCDGSAAGLQIVATIIERLS